MRITLLKVVAAACVLHGAGAFSVTPGSVVGRLVGLRPARGLSARRASSGPVMQDFPTPSRLAKTGLLDTLKGNPSNYQVAAELSQKFKNVNGQMGKKKVAIIGGGLSGVAGLALRSSPAAFCAYTSCACSSPPVLRFARL